MSLWTVIDNYDHRGLIKKMNRFLFIFDLEKFKYGGDFVYCLKFNRILL